MLPEDTDTFVPGFLAGEAEAVRVVSRWARAVVSHKAWDFQNADDLVQSTLLALLRNCRAGRFQGGNFRAYVRRIAKNLCISSYRKLRTRGDQIEFEETVHSTGNPFPGDELERHSVIERILAKLDETCRRIIWLAYLQELNRKEISNLLGISEGAARVRLFRCLKSGQNIAKEFGTLE